MNLRALYLPDIAVHRRLRIIKNLLALALLASFAVTWKLWAGERNIAHVPLFSAFPTLPLIAEQILFGFSILFCVLIFLSRKPTYFILGLFLCVTTLALADINRL